MSFREPTICWHIPVSQCTYLWTFWRRLDHCSGSSPIDILQNELNHLQLNVHFGQYHMHCEYSVWYTWHFCFFFIATSMSLIFHALNKDSLFFVCIACVHLVHCSLGYPFWRNCNNIISRNFHDIRYNIIWRNFLLLDAFCAIRYITQNFESIIR